MAILGYTVTGDRNEYLETDVSVWLSSATRHCGDPIPYPTSIYSL
jgi:hypothetical protein